MTSKTGRLSKEELAKTLADKEYWEEFSRLTGWPLYGWTDKDEASFLTKGNWGENKLLNLTGSQRDHLIKLLTGGSLEKLMQPCL